jgi:O-acetylhomoserine (thiol)-lyase
MKKNVDTICVQGGWEPENGAPRVLPIFQSTTFKYDSAEHMGELFNLAAAGHMYSRISNPTLDAVEKKIAEMEGGVGAMLCSSGQSASMAAILNIASSGDHIVSMSNIYGGTHNLFNVTLKNLGIDFTFVDQKDMGAVDKAVRANTKAIFGESIANPALTVLDIGAASAVAKKHKIPLIIDNTFPTPYLLRPFEHGADIVIHSTTKYMDGHAVSVGGAVVDNGKFDWEGSGKFPALTTPDASYHGVIYTKNFGNLAYIVKARTHIMRDLGCIMSPFNAFLLNLGLETLALRMDRHSENALKVAKFLEKHEKVEWVRYPLLPSSSEYEIAKKYLPKGAAGVVSFSAKGGKSAASLCIDNLKLFKCVVHVADLRSCVLHPATSTHRQLSEAELVGAGVNPAMIRLSVGIENADDIIADLEQALAKI